MRRDDPARAGPSRSADQFAADAGAKTSLASGNYDDAATNVVVVSSAAGMKPSQRNGTALWQTAELGAWLEYTVEVAAPGSYSIVVMYFCRVEYLVSPDAPGRYAVSLHYTTRKRSKTTRRRI